MNGINIHTQRGKSYYCNSIELFIADDADSILGKLVRFSFESNNDQRDAWINQIKHLQVKLSDSHCTGNIIFEYDIVRLGKRIDVILLIKHMVFSLEFKNGATLYKARDAEQAEDYALDLKNFHKESENLYVCPILVATEADERNNRIDVYPDKQVMLQYANKENLMSCISNVYEMYGSDEELDFEKWYNSQYCPTPTIIEAAIETYISNTVAEIAHSEAGQEDIDKCENEIHNIIKYAKENNKKCICFVTGVPGAGKTLVGLNLTSKTMSEDENNKAVYLSGNGPLVEVLREALIKNSIERKSYKDIKDKKEIKKTAKIAVQAFIQAAHAFRKQYILDANDIPVENVIIFDEAQRCWNKEKLSTWTKNKINKDIDMSEPQCFIDIMNRRKDWAVMICLVGLGQDIYDGEVGINEWFNSIIKNYPDWDLYYSSEIFRQIEDLNIDKDLLTGYKNAYRRDALHLSTSIRSFRSEELSELVDELLAGNSSRVRDLYKKIINDYPIYVTRDIKKAKQWARDKVRGSQRCGVIACSSAQRLKPEGIYVPTDIDAVNWFLAPKEDLRSSNAMEIVASEFKVQGLEIDYSVVCWDADLRRVNETWEYYSFKGTKWNKRNKKEQQRYLLNAYRVLLTRARQGMIIFIPEGEDPELDVTRNKEYYNGVYTYLVVECGLKEI